MSPAKEWKAGGYAAFVEREYGLGRARYGQAAALFKIAADRGNSNALFELGKLTCVGWGVPRDADLAQLYFQRG